jgi:nucleoside-diphosphate-sugar epimerase
VTTETARCLVTGGAGFIGSHLVDTLVQAGFPTTVLDDLSSGTPSYVKELATLTRHLHREGQTLLVDDAVQDGRTGLPLIFP